MSTNENLKQLSIAEQRATKLVADAREERQKRIREAKKEAQEKLAEYRAQKQSEFKNIESNFLGGSEQKIKGDIAKATDVDIDAMREEFRKNKTSGVNLLVDIVKKVEYGVPQALKDMHREG